MNNSAVLLELMNGLVACPCLLGWLVPCIVQADRVLEQLMGPEQKDKEDDDMDALADAFRRVQQIRANAGGLSGPCLDRVLAPFPQGSWHFSPCSNRV